MTRSTRPIGAPCFVVPASSAGQILYLSSLIGETQRNYTPEVVPASSAGLISNLPLPTSVVPASSAGQIPYLSSYFAKLDEII